MLKYWARPEAVPLAEGGYGCFLKGRMMLGPDALFKAVDADGLARAWARRQYSLSDKGLEVFFDAGQGRIFLDGKEITKGFGFYTSVLSKGIWQDSQNALWRVHKVDGKTLVATGEWVDVAVKQTWTIALKDAHTIQWHVQTRAAGLPLEAFTAGLILRDGFKAGMRDVMRVSEINDLKARHQVNFQEDANGAAWAGSVGRADWFPFKNTLLKYEQRAGKKGGAVDLGNDFKGEIRVE
jgi:hypothetical protein